MLSRLGGTTTLFVCLTGLLIATDSSALTAQPINRGEVNDGSNMNRMSAGKKRKFASDGLDILESFAALEGDPLDVHTLILGTLPSDKSYGQNLSDKEIVLRGGDGHQNYGHSRNSFWNIVGSAFGFHRHKTPYRMQVQVLTDQGYAVWDVLSKAKRKGSLDTNLVKGSLTPTDLPRFVLDHPNLNRFVFAANSAEVFCKKEIWEDWLNAGEATTNAAQSISSKTPKTQKLDGNQALDDNWCEETVGVMFWIRGEALNPATFKQTNSIFGKKKAVATIDDASLVRSFSKSTTPNAGDKVCDGNIKKLERTIELIVMPSTSPANARSRPPEKEKKWHVACYRFQEPPKHYVCPGCKHHHDSQPSPVICDETSSKHWFHDCPYREDWKAAKKKQKKKPSKKQEPFNDSEVDDIDPFGWYM